MLLASAELRAPFYVLVAPELFRTNAILLRVQQGIATNFQLHPLLNYASRHQSAAQ